MPITPLREDPSPAPGVAAPPAPGGALAPLAAAARGGDRPAFTELYARLAPMVHAILLGRVAPDDAEDLMQEVFLSAWRGLSKLRSDDHVGGWLATIARHAAARHHARARPRPGPLPATLHDRSAPEPGADETPALVLAALREVPETYRDALTMRLVEGLSGPEIADCAGLTRDSVRVHLSRGMKHLREILKRRGLP